MRLLNLKLLTKFRGLPKDSEFAFDNVESNTYSKMIRLTPMLDSVLSFDANDLNFKSNLMETVEFAMCTFQIGTMTGHNMANYNIYGKSKDYHFGATFLSYVLYTLEINGIESNVEIEAKTDRLYFRSKLIKYFKAIDAEEKRPEAKAISAVIANNPYAKKLLKNFTKEDISDISETEEELSGFYTC